MATTVRVSETTRARAAAIAARAGVSIGDVVGTALDAYEEKVFWEQTQAALASRDRGPDDQAWDATVRDGLDSA